MKKLLILGAGAGGTMVATKMRKKLDEREWEITVIDRDLKHHYQAGWLFIPFGIYSLDDCIKPKKDFMPRGVKFVQDTIVNVDPEAKVVKTENGSYDYDWLVWARAAASHLKKWTVFSTTGVATSTTSTLPTAQWPFARRCCT